MRFARNARPQLFKSPPLGFEELVGRQGLQRVLGSWVTIFRLLPSRVIFKVTERHRHVFVAHSQETTDAEHDFIYRSIGL